MKGGRTAKIQIKGTIIENGDKWIYDWFGMDSTCPRDVRAALDQANGQRVTVEVNSPGGSVMMGSEIYTALRSHAGGVLIQVVGIAGSAASVILCAGESEITPTGMVMVHNVQGSGTGDYHALDKSSEILQTANRALASAYMAKAGMTEAAALEMMDKETWLTAQQAVEAGLVDRVMFGQAGAGDLTAAVTGGMLPRAVVEKLRDMKAAGELPKPDGKNVNRLQLQLEYLKLKGMVC